MNSRRTIRPKRIERSREIYKAIAADAAACGMTPKQFAELFMEQAILELRKFSWISYAYSVVSAKAHRCARERTSPEPCRYKQRRRGGWSGCCQWRLLPREFPPLGTVYHYFRLWRTTSVWVHLYRGDREKPVTRLSGACSQAKLGLDLQAWIGGLLKGQPPTPGPRTLACGHAAP